MSTVYILKNQRNEFLDKSGNWVGGENSKSLYRSAHKDEAINQKVEFSVKQAALRISVSEAKLLDAGKLELSEEDLQAVIIMEDQTDTPHQDSEPPSPTLTDDEGEIEGSALTSEMSDTIDSAAPSNDEASEETSSDHQDDTNNPIQALF